MAAADFPLCVFATGEMGMGKGSDENMARDAKVFEDIIRFFAFSAEWPMFQRKLQNG